MSQIVNDDDNKVFVATGVSGDFLAGLVITWVSQASLNSVSPKIILVVSKFNSSLTVLEETRKLCLNQLSSHQLEELFTFGSRSSAECNKFEAFKFHHGLGGPELEGCAGYAHCSITKIFETPDRKILYCTVDEERSTGLGPMFLTDALELLTSEQRSHLINKFKRDIKRDEEQFNLL